MIKRRLVKRVATVALPCMFAWVAVACGDDDQATVSVATTDAVATTVASSGSTAATAAPATTVPLERIKLTVAASPAFTVLPQFVGKSAGIFDAAGLDIEFVAVAAGPEMAAAQIAGEINFAGNIPNNMLGLINAGFDVVAVGQQVSAQFFDLVVSSKFDLKGASTWQDVMAALTGANIGVVAIGAAAEDVARTLFKEAGVDPDAQTYIATGLPATTLAALSNGEIDAAVNFEPLFALAKAQGVGSQPFSLQAGEGPSSLNWPSLLITTARKFAEERPDAVKRYVDAVAGAIDFIVDPANKARVLEIVTEELGLSSELGSALYESNTRYFTPGAVFDLAALDRAGAWVHSIGKAPRPFTAAEFTLQVR